MTLTPREKQIVSRLLRYQKQAAIADELGISLRTVRAHIERARRRVNAQTVTALVVFFSHQSVTDQANGNGKVTLAKTPVSKPTLRVLPATPRAATSR